MGAHGHEGEAHYEFPDSPFRGHDVYCGTNVILRSCTHSSTAEVITFWNRSKFHRNS